jgi:ABC-2 type transport system permease protein
MRLPSPCRLEGDVFRIAWRLQRNGLAGMTLFGVLYGFFQAAAYKSAAGPTAASRIAFGHQMETFGRTFTFLLPVPVRLDTASGYVQWRIYGGIVTLLAVWALMSAVGATRADEDRGLVEEWLSSPVGRGRYLMTRFGAFALAAVIPIAATSASIHLVMAGSGYPLDPGAVVQESLVLLVLTLTCYALVLAVAQLPSRRATATGTAGALMAIIFLVNGFSRTDANLRPVARLISPFYYADRSMPLTPGGMLDLGATAGLLAAAVALAALAAWLMTVRDIGSPLLRRHRREHAVMRLPARSRWLRIPVLSSLYEHRIGLLAWMVGAAIGGAYVASIGRGLVNLMNGAGSFHAYLTLAGHSSPYVALTGYFWFGIFQLVLVAFALTYVAGWASDDNEGRLEMELSAPVSRRRVVIERALAFLASGVAVVAAGSAGFYLSAIANKIGLHPGDLIVASLVLIPFVLSFAALGAVLTSRVPRAAIAVLAALAFVSYLITEGGPLLKWPDWVMKLSAFSLYGTPLTNGVYWTGLWILLAITVLGFGAAAALMQRREVGR